MDRCIRKGAASDKLWDCLMEASKETEEAAINVRYRDNSTLLHYAVTQNQPTLCAQLLKRGIDKIAKNDDGLTALDIAVEEIEKATNGDDLREIIRVLLQYQVPASPENMEPAENYANQSVPQLTL